MTKRRSKAHADGFQAGLFGRRPRNRHRWNPEAAADYDIGVLDAYLVRKEVGGGEPIRVEHLPRSQ